MDLLPTIIDDIDHSVDGVPLYLVRRSNPSKVPNTFYGYFSTPSKRIKKKSAGISADDAECEIQLSIALKEARLYHVSLPGSEHCRVKGILLSLFPPDNRKHVNGADLYFLNYYYRRALRCRLELDCAGDNISYNSILLGWNMGEIDSFLARYIILIRLICSILGLVSSIDTRPFPEERIKETPKRIWDNIFDHAAHCVGESFSLKASYTTESEFFDKLNMFLSAWSGSRIIPSSPGHLALDVPLVIMRCVPIMASVYPAK